MESICELQVPSPKRRVTLSNAGDSQNGRPSIARHLPQLRSEVTRDVPSIVLFQSSESPRAKVSASVSYSLENRQEPTTLRRAEKKEVSATKSAPSTSAIFRQTSLDSCPKLTSKPVVPTASLVGLNSLSVSEQSANNSFIISRTTSNDANCSCELWSPGCGENPILARNRSGLLKDNPYQDETMNKRKRSELNLEEEEPEIYIPPENLVVALHRKVALFKRRNADIIRKLVYATMLGAVNAYVISVLWHHHVKDSGGMSLCDGPGLLLVSLVTFYVVMSFRHLVKPLLGKLLFVVVRRWAPCLQRTQRLVDNEYSRAGFHVFLLLGVTVGFLAHAEGSFERLRSGFGFIVVMCMAVLLSSSPAKIEWSLAVRGVVMQMLVAVSVAHVPLFRDTVECLGGKVDEFLQSSKTGLAKAYGPYGGGVFSTPLHSSMINGNYSQKMPTVEIAFEVRQQVYAFHLTAVLGLRTYWNKITHSEAHVVLLAVFATASGGTILVTDLSKASFGRVLLMSLLTLPAVILISKLVFPEIKHKVFYQKRNMLLREDVCGLDCRNWLDAGSRGSSLAAEIVITLVSTIVSFSALLSLINGVVEVHLRYLGYPGSNLVTLATPGFLPFVWLTGVNRAECWSVAELLARRSFENVSLEIVTWKDLMTSAYLSAKSFSEDCQCDADGKHKCSDSSCGSQLSSGLDTRVKASTRTAYFSGLFCCIYGKCCCGSIIW
ncbi:unnamed protein product [Notodromas monacha]|uniref:Uncharacterized protein n=1 Tax=Notodromas monacha TaxID=399045 RepID=A0A7R9GBI8_9CRUS|nr:unnamed protein product [Notodromas monacha]CAG0914859.1 unnamed protein product [Notodromas monacha]